MSLQFHLHYRTVFGEQIGIQYFTDDENKKETMLMQTYDGEVWSGSLQIKSNTTISYKYVLLKNNQIVHTEWGKYRSLQTTKSGGIYLMDKWRPRADENNAFLSTAFTDSIFRRESTKSKEIAKKTTKSKFTLVFRLISASIQPNLSFGVVGSTRELGEWKTPVLLNDSKFPLWETTINHESALVHAEYKYVVCDPKDGTIKAWEDGENRICQFVLPENEDTQIMLTDHNFRYSDSKWRGTGVAIPVFSLRSEHGMGIGEFTDIKGLVDWSHHTGMNVIQVLPVNDTIANKTWTDSYPYAAISVFALHPLFINLQSIASFEKKSDKKSFENILTKLNALESVDFDQVLEHKFRFLRLLFAQEYQAFKKSPDVMNFIQSNADWLKPYAVFCHLRDKYKTCNFNSWPEYSKFSTEAIESFCLDKNENIKEIEFYYFLQYHADKQLSAAKLYARDKRIVLKGDLPIGIYRYSCDAWVAPELYNMNEQAGAPPDDYAVLGQNWGFPTYNWAEMSKDGFAWWRKRMKLLNRYFDALRIDHILGFFRIWQIPTNQIEGTMGMFNPRLPLSRTELYNYGISGDLSDYSTPHITQEILLNMFGYDLEQVFEIFFSISQNGKIVFKSSFDNQFKISVFIAQNPGYSKYEKQLLHLMTEVLLLEEPGSNGEYFNPRITLTTTNVYNHLDNKLKAVFTALYNDYYFSRHDEYWRQQAIWKLPAILDASDMLICGEDLGMIPKAVPGVMKDMNIISLEIQRMPKGTSKFGQVRAYPYFSVCSPSCHDMSTIRGYWESNHDTAKDFYYNYLHWYGLTPMECTTDILQAIVEDHLMSPSMLAIFPIQDLVGMDAGLRKKDALSEQINEPSNPKHYWRYRFHINMEALNQSTELNNKIKYLVLKSGR